MSRAVRFAQYGGVERGAGRGSRSTRPSPGRGSCVVRVRAAGIEPVRIQAAQRGLFAWRKHPAVSFPAAQGNDFAGVVEGLGQGVEGFKLGDGVLGSSAKRGSQAELTVAAQERAPTRPAALSWEVAGGLWTVGTTAYASVAAVSPGAGDLVVVSGAAGGVGGLAAQLARQRGATVIGVAVEASHAWLRSRGIVPVAYGDGVGDRLRAAAADAGAPIRRGDRHRRARLRRARDRAWASRPRASTRSSTTMRLRDLGRVATAPARWTGRGLLPNSPR